MDNKLIITIDREFGSGGHEVGKRLAKVLGINFYDTNFISITVNKTGYTEEYVKNNDEKAPNFAATTLIGGNYMDLYYPDPCHKIQEAEYSTIKEIASKGSCIIVGRAADYILRDERLIRLFIYAPFEDRVRRKLALMRSNKKENLTKAQMEKLVRQMDKHRRKFYEFYTDNKWGCRESYDMMINTSCAGIEGSVKIIKTFIDECAEESIMPDDISAD